jgi:hypothetical protein
MEIISLAKKKYSVPDLIIITTQTVRQRVKRGRHNGHAGHKTPIEDIELYLRHGNQNTAMTIDLMVASNWVRLIGKKN